MKLYPFDVPEGMHPMAWTLLGFGWDGEMLNRVAKHLFDDLGATLPSTAPREVSFSWVVGLGEREGRTAVDVGDLVGIPLTGGAVRVTDGVLPPGVRLDRSARKLVGAFTHTGLYSVTVTIGPVVKYDPLGSPGGPHDPGIWIPIDQPRQEPITRLDQFPATADGLSELEKDMLLAELLAERTARTIQEVDNGH